RCRAAVDTAAMTMPLPSFIFMAFTAAYLAIRGVFICRARRQHKTDRGDLRDRLLIALVGLGQIVLPLLFVWTRAVDFADRAQPAVCLQLGAIAMAAGL